MCLQTGASPAAAAPVHLAAPPSCHEEFLTSGSLYRISAPSDAARARFTRSHTSQYTRTDPPHSLPSSCLPSAPPLTPYDRTIPMPASSA